MYIIDFIVYIMYVVSYVQLVDELQWNDVQRPRVQYNNDF